MNEKYHCFHIYSPGLYYSAEPVFHSGIALDSKTGFASLYAVSGQDREAIEQAGTTKGFAGVVWGQRLWLDVDSYEAADKVETKLKEMKYDYVAYDTGGRGAHFGILRNSAPSHLLPAQDRAWAKKHFESEADTSIYTHLHLFRLPGTIHASTGKPKVLVTRQSGESLIYAKLDNIIPSSSGNLGTLSTLQSDSNSRSVFDNFDIMAQTGPARNGNRHPTLVRLAYSLKGASVPVDKSFWWLCEANKMFPEPKDEKEIEKIVRDVYGSEG